MLTCKDFDSANANAWQSGRVQKDGQESSVSLTFCFVVGASALQRTGCGSGVARGSDTRSGARARRRWRGRRGVKRRGTQRSGTSTLRCVPQWMKPAQKRAQLLEIRGLKRCSSDTLFAYYFICFYKVQSSSYTIQLFNCAFLEEKAFRVHSSVKRRLFVSTSL